MMRFTPRLLLALLLLQLWGCSLDRSLRLKCKGECSMEVENNGTIESPKDRQ